MALYREYNPIIDSKKAEIIFDDNMFNKDISMQNISNIELFYNKEHYIPEECAKDLLNFIVAYSRKSVCGKVGTPLVSDMTGMCSPSANINLELLTKMGFDAKILNVNSVIGVENPIHELCSVKINVIDEYNRLCEKEYIIDPTFKQFCLKEGCRYERFFEEKRYSIRKSTPMPGYFLSLTDNGKEFANNLIYNGYFETTDENLKTYFDAFSLFCIEKQDYQDENLIGKTSQTITTPYEYRNRFNNSFDRAFPVNNINIKTPLEYYNKLTKNSIGNFFNKKKNQEMINQMQEPEFIESGRHR